ncbi:glycosyltransferase family 2 protein [Beggiatoa leptomitoformis]|uniref:Glycosyltransferase n=1 Tax=Beggiatoa leptomitoformis TaxID=288004 RepID=A0A2N9YA42_9GAMM|nr:glycosyltransferase family 2 protein [Beggiatoa leptomitoformis]ALG67247.1 glycosyltransferase [Beggiatoa leptomitoformis]AUI67331.1 glycosyltransferase [Beggiatoa leptomitoformis]
MKTINLVIPVFNEAQAIDKHLPAIVDVLITQPNITWHILIVDDGSTDTTVAKLHSLRESYPQLSVLCLNRNFGKEAAIYAGLQQSRTADAVIVMDSDLQHPPALIPEMVRLWTQGLQVIEGYKTERGKESWSSRWLAKSFYFIFSLLSDLDLKNHCDFKLLDKTVVTAYCELPERNRFFRGMVQWMGFSTAQLPFNVPPRQHGETTWSHLKLLKYSFTAIMAFSSTLLQIVTFLGVLTFCVGLLISCIALYKKFMGSAIGGFTTVILLIFFMSSILMIALGLIGIYVANIYDEVKRRPNYFINWQKSTIKEKIDE